MKAATTLKLEGALVSDIGMRRKQNQDSGISLVDEGLFIVADGMGGHQGGEIASQLCVDKMVAHIRKYEFEGEDDTLLLQQSIQAANQAIHERASLEPRLAGMGTTATALKISGAVASIIQVGDSRAYFWNAEGIWQLTRDHSLVQEKLRAGLIKRDQIKTDEMKNVITRSVGYEANVRGEIFQIGLEPGDGFLLCSDGLSGPLDDSSLFNILREGETKGLPLSEIARDLIHAANARGGEDNITALLVKAIEV